MKIKNSNNSKNDNKKTLRPPKAELEKSRQQKAAARQEEQAIQETEIVSKALNALQTADRKSAAHTYLAGKSLGKIKDGKLYRVQGHKSFKEFVGEKFNISEQYAYMLINAAGVQDVLTKAAVAPEYVPEKLLRKLTSLRKTEEGRAKIAEIWKTATGNDPKAIPPDKALADAVAASKSKRQPSVAKNRSDSEILADPAAEASDIISILRKLTTGKTHLNGDDLSMLKDRLSAICDEAANMDDNN